jgi:hypothetical protein
VCVTVCVCVCLCVFVCVCVYVCDCLFNTVENLSTFQVPHQVFIVMIKRIVGVHQQTAAAPLQAYDWNCATT